MTSTVKIDVRTSRSELVIRTLHLLERKLKERTGLCTCRVKGDETPDVVMDIRSGMGAEGFAIEDVPNGPGVLVAGADERGLLYGVGKLLRDARLADGCFNPGQWRGTSVPDCPMRGMYFASHFHNFYHDAPVEEICRYVEDLSLWGINALQVWYDMHHFEGIDDPAAREMIERLRTILAAAKRLGMDAGLCLLANEAYANSPEDLRADGDAGRGHYGVELCPHKPGAKELMLRWFDQEFVAFSDVGIDNIWIWPYDQGGCTCDKCSPWGANGFLLMAEAIAERARRHFPNVTVILSTWLFDFREDEGEWRGLAREFAATPDWVDYVLADGHDEYPRYPLDNGVPGGLPLLSFPEISMWRSFPWGGYGANPVPSHLQDLWNTAGNQLSGGFPYSEGIYEDVNKAVFSQLFWDRDRTAINVMEEYAAAEFGHDVADEVLEAIRIMEKNHARHPGEPEEGRPIINLGGEGIDVQKCHEMILNVDSRLDERVRDGWRWRVFFLRSLIDRELYENDGTVTSACQEAFDELRRIYHAADAEPQVAPPGNR
jgi:hypothetical protein